MSRLVFLLLSCYVLFGTMAVAGDLQRAQLVRLDELLAAGKAQTAVEMIQGLLADGAVEPRNVWRLRQRLAVAFLNLDQPQAAVMELEAALAEAPEDPALHLNLGRALWRLDRQGRAVAHYETAVELAPDRHLWRIEYAEVLLAMGIGRNAMQQIRLARTICGDCPEALRAEVNLYLDRGDHAGSLEPLRLLYEQEPRVDFRRLLAAALWVADKPAALVSLLDTVAVSDLTAPEMMLLAQSDRRLGLAERALAWVRQELEPLAGGWEPEPHLWAIVSEICLSAGHPSEALAAIDRALARSPQTAVYHHNRAVILFQLGQESAAEEALFQAQRLRLIPGPCTDDEELTRDSINVRIDN